VSPWANRWPVSLYLGHLNSIGYLDRQPRARGQQASSASNCAARRALLAYLAAIHEPVRREALATLFFPDTDDPLGALRWQLSEMRRQIGPALLVAHRDRVQLDHAACWVDADTFERALDDSAARSIEQIVTNRALAKLPNP